MEANPHKRAAQIERASKLQTVLQAAGISAEEVGEHFGDLNWKAAADLAGLKTPPSDEVKKMVLAHLIEAERLAATIHDPLEGLPRV